MPKEKGKKNSPWLVKMKQSKPQWQTNRRKQPANQMHFRQNSFRLALQWHGLNFKTSFIIFKSFSLKTWLFLYNVYLSVPVVAAVVNPLLHDGVIRIQVDWDVFVLWIEHVAKFLQSAVLWAAAGGVPQVVHDVRHVHFTCNMTTTKRRSKQISWRGLRILSGQFHVQCCATKH